MTQLTLQDPDTVIHGRAEQKPYNSRLMEPTPARQPAGDGRLQLLCFPGIPADFPDEAPVRAEPGLRMQPVSTSAQLGRALAVAAPDAFIGAAQALEAMRAIAAQCQPPATRLPLLGLTAGEAGIVIITVETLAAGDRQLRIREGNIGLGQALAAALRAWRAWHEHGAQPPPEAQAEHRLRDQLQTRLEAERSELARELHDELGGALTAAGFDLGWIERHGDAGIAARARAAQSALGEAMRAAQRVVRELRPPIAPGELPAALDALAEGFRRRSGVQLHLATHIAAPELDTARSLAVYRTVQEALANVLKHAEASIVSIDLVVTADEVSLEISDDGRGMKPDARVGYDRFGLRGMAERARALGGRLEILDVERGSAILLYIPRQPEIA